jgi:alkanesulfonate monooxygenase SsuD/methylene tetrahydromethanopterin reductase-like flavin-dependent oxidoreductase (luciferase family)
VSEVRAEQEAAGRGDQTLHIFADLVVFLGVTAQEARAGKARLDEAAGAEYASDALIFTGTPAQLATLLLDWQGAGLSGFRLRPGAIPHDLRLITRGLVPQLQHHGSFRTSYAGTTLRDRLGLARPASRYAAAID